ncbi:MAG: hypothetical protein DELT_02486 [Desulfovibrio sp.]
MMTSNSRRVIRLYDTTTHGGEVIQVTSEQTVSGRRIACVGDLVRCPKCDGVYPIVEGDPQCTIRGIPVAFEGHRTACGALLVGSD